MCLLPAFDTQPDTRDKPLATPVKVRELARRSAKAVEAVTVWIGGGTYCLSQPIVFTDEDSGCRPEAARVFGGDIIGVHVREQARRPS